MLFRFEKKKNVLLRQVFVMNLLMKKKFNFSDIFVNPWIMDVLLEYLITYISSTVWSDHDFLGANF